VFLSEKHKFKANVYQMVFDIVSTQLLNGFHDTSDLMPNTSYLDPRRFNIFKDNNNLSENAFKSLSKISGLIKYFLVD